MFKHVNYALELLLVFVILFSLFILLLIYFRLDQFEEVALCLGKHSIYQPEAALTIEQITQRYSPQLIEVVIVEEHVATS